MWKNLKFCKLALIVGSSGIKARLAKRQGHKCPCKLVDGCYMTIELIVNSCKHVFGLWRQKGDKILIWQSFNVRVQNTLIFTNNASFRCGGTLYFNRCRVYLHIERGGYLVTYTSIIPSWFMHIKFMIALCFMLCSLA